MKLSLPPKLMVRCFLYFTDNSIVLVFLGFLSHKSKKKVVGGVLKDFG
jgi:hypothetical protein